VTSILLTFALVAGNAASSDVASRFEARVFKGAARETLPYRIFIPAGHRDGKKYPLVLWLHGGGGRGSDNRRQLAEGNATGATIWARPENQARFPSFVLAPQCPPHQMWTTIGADVRIADPLRLVVKLLEQLSKEFRIDASRLYVAGQSMGGFAAWALVTEHPRLFAAAVPVCGGGNEQRASHAAAVAVWAFHGELDRAVSVRRSRGMIAAIERAGGRPRYTEYKGAGHVVWDRAFGEPELLPWVFAQERDESR
jgi:predicted peptidase